MSYAAKHTEIYRHHRWRVEFRLPAGVHNRIKTMSILENNRTGIIGFTVRLNFGHFSACRIGSVHDPCEEKNLPY